MLTINPQSEVFISKFDQIQDELETLASMDELLSGNNYLWLPKKYIVSILSGVVMQQSHIDPYICHVQQ